MLMGVRSIGGLAQLGVFQLQSHDMVRTRFCSCQTAVIVLRAGTPQFFCSGSISLNHVMFSFCIYLEGLAVLVMLYCLRCLHPNETPNRSGGNSGSDACSGSVETLKPKPMSCISLLHIRTCDQIVCVHGCICTYACIYLYIYTHIFVSPCSL